MIIRNVKVYTEEKEFRKGEIAIQDGRIKEVEYGESTQSKGNGSEEKVLDGEGCYAIPGLIDLSIRGTFRKKQKLPAAGRRQIWWE